MGLDASIELRLGSLHLSAGLAVDSGTVVAILGPNGAGKTTMLRAIAGLRQPDRARVVLDGTVLDDSATRRHVPTDRRSIGFVFQDLLLFDHLTVIDNAAFGLRARGASRSASRRAALPWLERLGVAAYAADRPRALSGGQAQRVALARALATEPSLLLLDEPLAALDAETRVAVRSDLRRHLHDFAGTRVLVTHDPIDAMVLADRLVVLEEGRVTHDGTPADLSARPRSPYVAELVGQNLWRGTARGTTVEVAGGGTLSIADPTSGAVFVTAPPHTVALHAEPPSGSPRNAWLTTVSAVERFGDRVRVRLDGAPPVVAEITLPAMAELGMEPGRQLWATLKATELSVAPGASAAVVSEPVSTAPFRDRRHAGQVLAERLRADVAFDAGDDLVVLGLPRGGVPVAAEVARALGAPLDVFVVRKLGVPGHEELAMGAIATGGVVVLNESVVRTLRIEPSTIERVATAERIELERRQRVFRGDRPDAAIEGRTVIVVDDGLATGSTMRAAVEALRRLHPARIVVAVPVAARETCSELAADVDDVVCALTPEPFRAVGQAYDDFTQTDDEEVRALL